MEDTKNNALETVVAIMKQQKRYCMVMKSNGIHTAYTQI